MAYSILTASIRSPETSPHWFFPEDDNPVYLSDTHGRWLHELSDRFDMVWASAWGGGSKAPDRSGV